MTADYPVEIVPATPEYFLTVFQDWHRIATEVGEANSHSPPTFETTYLQFEKVVLNSDDMMGYCFYYFDLAKNVFGEFERPEMKSLLARSSTNLKDVCNALAVKLSRQAVRPWRGTGTTCAPAGAFLTVRSILADLGESPNDITPSTELEPYLRRRDSTFLSRIAPLAPGRVPSFRVNRWTDFMAFFCIVIGFLGVFTSLVLYKLLGKNLAVQLGGTSGILFVAGILTAHLGRRFVTGVAHFGNLRTFRDLAYCLAGEEPRRRAA